MGIVHALANKPCGPCVTSSVGEERPCIYCASKSDRKPGNPGSAEDIHKKVKDLYPQNFEGAKLVVNKKLSDHFDAKHTLTLSSVTPSGYRFGANYVGSKRVGLNERYPSLTGDISPNGSMTATFIHTIGCRFRYKLAAQIANHKYNACSSSLEYRSDDFTAAMTLANPNFLKQHGTLALHFLQAVTSRIALGAEVACLRGPEIPGGQQAIMSAVFRHDTGRTALSATVGAAGLHVCFYRKCSGQLELGVEIETNMRTHESLATIVYKIDIPFANVVFRGIVNSKTSVGAVFEKKLYPIPESSLVISGFLNHAKQQFRVGIGLNIAK